MTEYPVVEISLGKAKGRKVSKVKDGKDVFLFTSLPFAKPPVGELRFKHPVRAEPWEGVLNATQHPPSPLQDPKVMADFILNKVPAVAERKLDSYSEDCLYLSVYTPNMSKSANQPVLFWLYGGGLSTGGEVFYDASVLASLHDVVVVIPNYRVNVFGFLSLGPDSDHPGNAGLVDQVMALQWTRDHIRAFGGNPDNVTIFGESAGAASVNFHVLSPMSKGLFHRAISQSGSMFMGDFPRVNDPAALLALGEELKLEENDPQKLVKRLKSIPAEDIVKAVGKIGEKMMFFPAVIDGKYFTKSSSELKKEPVANKVPYIIGMNNTEGFGILVMQFPPGFSEDVCMETLKGYIGVVLNTTLPDSAFDVIKKEYAKGKADDDKMKWSKVYGEVLADILFVVPNFHASQHHVDSKAKTYNYVMTHQTKCFHDAVFGPEVLQKAPFCQCDHGDDILYTMGIPMMEKKLTFDMKFTDDEKKLSKEWIKYIVNFAKNGDPNIGLPVKTNWPEYNCEDQEYLSVQQPCTIGRKFGEKNFKLWQEVILPMQTKTSADASQQS